MTLLRSLTLLLALALLPCGLAARAAWGERDCTFGGGGSVDIGTEGTPFAISLYSDGRYMVRRGSSVLFVPSNGTGAMVGYANQYTGSGVQDMVDVVDSAGAIYYATGAGDLPFGSLPPGLVRLSAPGTLDATFGTGGRATASGFTLAAAGPILQPDGRILVGGTAAGTAAVVRFNTNGTPDTTFGTGGITSNPGISSSQYHSIALQSDGKVLALSTGGLTRFLSTGQVDASFGTGGVAAVASSDATFAVRVQPSGKIVVAAYPIAVASKPISLTVFDSAGVQQSTTPITTSQFPAGQDAIGIPAIKASPVYLMPDGRLVITGVANGKGVVSRFSADLVEQASALLDRDFNPATVLVLSDGRVVLGGFATTHGRLWQEVHRVLGDADASNCVATTTTIASSVNPSATSQLVTFTATVSAPGSTPTGSVWFWYPNGSSGSTIFTTGTLVNGAATFLTTTLPVGSNVVTATYHPDGGSFAISDAIPITQYVGTGVAGLTVNDPTANSAVATPTMTFSVALAGGAPPSSTVTVDYATTDQSAKAGIDYTATSGILTFNPGETSKTVIVQVTPKTTPESSKTFFLTLSNPAGAAIAKGAGVGTIAYAAAGALSIYIGDASVAEGYSGWTLMGFTVSLSKPNATPVTVDFATANSSAMANTDYLAQSGTLTFPAGQTQRWVIVPVLGNAAAQSNRDFFVNLSNASAGVIARVQATGTIVDDDPTPAAATVPMYRLYSDITKEHLYTTDANEYAVLGTRDWVQENVAYTMFSSGGTYGAQHAIPLYRMYFPGILQHHWTTDAYEVTVLNSQGAWQYEGIAGYLLPSPGAGTVALHRLMYAYPPLHLWTIDSYEKDVLSTQYGWVYEGAVGEVLP